MLDFIEDKINCPHCGQRIVAKFCLEGDPNGNPVVVTGIDGPVDCSKCKKKINQEDLRDKKDGKCKVNITKTNYISLNKLIDKIL